MNKKIILAVFAGLVVGAVAGFLFPHQTSQTAGTISPAGTTNSTAPYYSQTLSLATAAATTTSLFNNSGFDIAYRAVDVTCQGVGTSKTAYTGAGLANLNFKAATSSTNTTTGNVTDINANYLANVNIGTSTTDDYVSTTTEGVIQGTSRIWPSGTYLIVSANATNTASCAVGVSGMRL